MILTLTLNPSVDISYPLDQFNLILLIGYLKQAKQQAVKD